MELPGDGYRGTCVISLKTLQQKLSGILGLARVHISAFGSPSGADTAVGRHFEYVVIVPHASNRGRMRDLIEDSVELKCRQGITRWRSPRLAPGVVGPGDAAVDRTDGWFAGTSGLREVSDW